MIGDRIEQTTLTTGTGPITLEPPPAGKLAFIDEIADGTAAYYTIEDGDDFEEGIGTVGANSLTRDTLIKSSTNAFLNLSGFATVRCTPLAEMLGGIGGRLYMAAAVANSGTTFIVTTRPRLRALVDGARVRFRANVTNTLGGASANVDSTGAKPIRKGDFAPMEPFEIRRNDIYEIVYDAEADCWQLQSPIHILGPQKLINGSMLVAQRGTSFSSIQFGDTLLDRWRYLGSDGGGTAAAVDASQRAFDPGQTEVDGGPINYLRISPQDVGSGLAAGSSAIIAQRLPDVRRFPGGRYASRIWLRSDIPGKRIAFRLRRVFGSGGSSDDFVLTQASHALGTVWQPFEIFWNIPTLSGLTVDAGSFLGLQIFLQWGDNFDFDFGTDGGEGWRAPGFIDIAEAKFEPGHLVTRIDRRSFAQDLVECLPFYTETIGTTRGPASAANQTFSNHVRWPLPMRVPPAIELGTPGSIANVIGGVAETFDSSREGVRLQVRSAAAGDCHVVGLPIRADAEI